MNFKKGDKIYLRLNYRLDPDKGIEGQALEDHLAYVNNLARKGFFLGGAFTSNRTGEAGSGNQFVAENYEEAKKIVENDPITKTGLYRSEIFEWDLAVVHGDVD